MTIQNYQHAYYTALVLAITAEDDELQKACQNMAEVAAMYLTENQLRACQKKIESIIGGSKK